MSIRDADFCVYVKDTDFGICVRHTDFCLYLEEARKEIILQTIYYRHRFLFMLVIQISVYSYRF